MNYYKILNKSEKHNGMQYHTGLNINCEEFNPTGDCTRGGMYFSREDILAFLSYGPWIRQVTLCPDSKIYENPGQPVKWKTDKFVLGEKRKITLEVIKQLIDEGANIHAGNECALRWASRSGHLKIVKFLVNNNANINVDNTTPLILASGNNHLNIVKYLIKYGADVSGDNNCAIQMASESGYLNIVKYLIKYGADVKSLDNYSVRWAARNGHLDTVKCLIQHGADIHSREDYALQAASTYGHLNVVKYIMENYTISTNSIVNSIMMAESGKKQEIVNYINEKTKKNK